MHRGDKRRVAETQFRKCTVACGFKSRPSHKVVSSFFFMRLVWPCVSELRRAFLFGPRICLPQHPLNVRNCAKHQPPARLQMNVRVGRKAAIVGSILCAA